MHARSHVVERLPVHLKGQQNVAFVNGKEERAVDEHAAKATKLMAYFEVSKARHAARAAELQLQQQEASAACASSQQDEPSAACASSQQNEPDATCASSLRDEPIAACASSQQDEPSAACAKTLNPDNDPLKYTEIPNHYVWDSKYCRWNKRQRRAKGGEVIGRMYQCSPKDPELYALRLLLLHAPGVRGFPDLYKIDDDPDNTSFRAAAKVRGLMQNSDDVDLIITEMMNSECSWNKQCELFALLLVWHDIGDVRQLREQLEDHGRAGMSRRCQ